jgi:hypothetical protein
VGPISLFEKQTFGTNRDVLKELLYLYSCIYPNLRGRSEWDLATFSRRSLNIETHYRNKLIGCWNSSLYLYLLIFILTIDYCGNSSRVY